jgi:hypothetical protein
MDGSVATVPIFDVKAILVAFIMIGCKCVRKSLLPITISLHERQKIEKKPLVKYTPDHFGNQQGKDTVVMI